MKCETKERGNIIRSLCFVVSLESRLKRVQAFYYGVVEPYGVPEPSFHKNITAQLKKEIPSSEADNWLTDQESSHL
jgi:hypothetical protein